MTKSRRRWFAVSTFSTLMFLVGYWAGSTKIRPPDLPGLRALIPLPTCTSTPTATPAPAGTSTKPAIDRAKFEGLYRAAKRIDATINAGKISYQDFKKLAGAFSTELSIAKDHATTKEDNELIGLYERVEDTYRDSAALFDARMDFGQQSNFTDPAANVMFPLSPPLLPIVRKYTLPLISGGDWLPVSSIRQVWAVASTQIAQANALYIGAGVSEQTYHGGVGQVVEKRSSVHSAAKQ